MDISQIDKNFAVNPINEPDIEWIDARDPRFLIYGVYFDEAEDAFVRIPRDVATATNDGVAVLYRHTSGGRVRFITDSPYVAVKAVVAKSFARIHVANLINFGIVPMTLQNPDDYDLFAQGDEIAIEGFAAAVAGATECTLVNLTTGAKAALNLAFSARQREILLAGGTLNYTKQSK